MYESNRTRLVLFSHLKMNYLTHKEFCDRPRLNSCYLYAVRTVSLIVHAIVIVLGLYTRYPYFFAQFTNWTNMISALYESLAWTEHTRYLRMQDSQKDRPSRLASFLYQFLSFIGPVHVIVTATYWPFCWKHAKKSTWQDLVYIVCAHGVTLVLLYIEKSALGSRLGQPSRCLTIFNC